MLRRSFHCLLPVAVLALAALVSGCTAPAAPAPTTSTPSAAASVTPTPTSTSAATAELVITVDAVIYEEGAESDTVSLDDGAGVVALIQKIAGEGSVEEFEGPYGGEGGQRHIWEGISVSVFSADGRSVVSVDAPTVGGAPVATPDGIAVGATRADALAAQAFEACSYDGDGDGNTDSLATQAEEVAGTRSLCRTDMVGIVFVDISFTGDTVTRLSSPANDFSDI